MYKMCWQDNEQVCTRLITAERILRALKRGYYVLVGGAVVFAIGIALTWIWALPLAQQLDKDTSITQGTKLASNESQTMSLDVQDPSKKLSIVINANNDAKLTAVLTDPAGTKYIDTPFVKAVTLSANPTVPGVYRLEITNIGSEPTEIDAIFGHLPGTGSDRVNAEMFSGIIAGIGIIIAGIIVMIVGIVIVVVDRKK